MFILQYINDGYMKKYEHIGVFETQEIMFGNMSEFHDSYDYKPPYFRQWKNENGWTIQDFGSHTRFHKWLEVKEMITYYKTIESINGYVFKLATIITEFGLLGYGIGITEEDAYADALTKIN